MICGTSALLRSWKLGFESTLSRSFVGPGAATTGRRDMRGTMIWFNADKGHGFIRTEEDERLIVHSDGFTDGEPVGRCAGNDVSFDRETVEGEVRAVNVATVPIANSRRARRRGY
jgi:cold shock CspA family protein